MDNIDKYTNVKLQINGINIDDNINLLKSSNCMLIGTTLTVDDVVDKYSSKFMIFLRPQNSTYHVNQHKAFTTVVKKQWQITGGIIKDNVFKCWSILNNYSIKCVKNVTIISDQDCIIDKRNENFILISCYINFDNLIFQEIKKHHKHVKVSTSLQHSGL